MLCQTHDTGVLLLGDIASEEEVGQRIEERTHSRRQSECYPESLFGLHIEHLTPLSVLKEGTQSQECQHRNGELRNDEY